MVNDKNANKGVYAGKAPYNKLMAGDIKYVDVDGSGAIDTGANTLDDPGDRKIIGNTNPRYNYSLRGDFQPYVKVEYYMYARETDTITDAYPTIKIGTKTYAYTDSVIFGKDSTVELTLEKVDDKYVHSEYGLMIFDINFEN